MARNSSQRRWRAWTARLAVIALGIGTPIAVPLGPAQAATTHTVNMTNCNTVAFTTTVNVGDQVDFVFNTATYTGNYCMSGDNNTGSGYLPTSVGTISPAFPANYTRMTDGTWSVTLVGSGFYKLAVCDATGGCGSNIGFSVVAPTTAPAAPTSLSATPGNGSASVAFTAGSDGGSAITNYKYQVDGGAWTALSPAVTTSPVTIPGLTSGTQYSIKLRAINSIGEGTASAAVTVTSAPEAPAAPTSLSATPGNGSASVAFTAGSDGGSAITNYKYQVDGGAWTALSPAVTTSPVTIPGLANGTQYSIKLRAVNSIGDGAESAAVTVTPVAPAVPDSGGGSSSGSDSTPAPTPTPTASTPATPDLGPELPGSNPNLPAGGVPLGGSVMLVNGQPAQVTVKPDAPKDATGLDVTGDGFTMRLVGRTANDKPLGVTPDGALILEQDRTAYTEGTGFKPNSEVKLYVFSEPRYLGTVMTDANGSFRGSVPLPLDIQAGRHTLQTNGLAPNDAVRSLSLGVQVLAPAVKTAKVRTAEATVYFSALSPKLDAADKKSLQALAAGRGKATTKIVAVGYVQPTATTSNDEKLSLERATAVASYLKSIGVKGVSVTRGDGIAKETGAAGRKAVVTITYKK